MCGVCVCVLGLCHPCVDCGTVASKSLPSRPVAEAASGSWCHGRGRLVLSLDDFQNKVVWAFKPPLCPPSPPSSPPSLLPLLPHVQYASVLAHQWYLLLPRASTVPSAPSQDLFSCAHTLSRNTLGSCCHGDTGPHRLGGCYRAVSTCKRR